jgi:hypothetical protein
MATGTVRVHGLRALQRDFRRISKSLSKEVRDGLRKAADPVRVEAAALLAPISADSAAGYKIRVRQRGVALEQSRRRTTGLRPDYAKLQFARAMAPAVANKENEVVKGLEDALDDLAKGYGF